MRRGCIAIGKVACDDCHRPLKYGERYLVVNEEGGERQRLCVDCCRKHDYLSHTAEKGKQTLTFLPKE
jgi:RNase P subunit RPR2